MTPRSMPAAAVPPQDACGFARVLALALALSMAFASPAALAAPTTGDGAASASAIGDGPRRLPDGAVHLPKRSQRQAALRTVLVEQGRHARAVPLAGRVVNDPNAGGQAQASVAGRIEPPEGGLPVLGARVVRGQVLARIRASVDPLQRAGHASLLAELEESRRLAGSRLGRLRELADTVPRKDIEAAASELASLDARIAALSAGSAPVEVLRAPVGGIIASARAIAGQVVDAREPLFEIVDPTRLMIEATAYDAALAGQVAGASVEISGGAVPLVFVGAGRVLRDQAIPMLFRGSSARLAGLAVGQPVEVIVRLGDETAGIAVPRAALARNAANDAIVWVKTGPERFEPRRVRAHPLDGTRERVTDGLRAGERVVTDGAALLGQVR